MRKQQIVSSFIGFVVLFIIYHFPEFFSALWIMATFKIGFLVVAYIIARLQGWKGLGGYGLAFSFNWPANLVKGLIIGLIFFGLSFFGAVSLGYEKVTATSSLGTILHQLPLLLLMTAIPSVAEDILTRGYLFGHLKFMKPFAWILLSSAVYVLNHIWRLQEGAAVLSYLFLLGLVLAAAVWITRSLWLAFGIHWGANIAFESSHSFIQSTTVAQHEEGTWLLAAAWAVLFLLLLMVARKKFRPIHTG